MGAAGVVAPRSSWLLRDRAVADARLCGPGAAQGHRPAHVSSAHIWWFVSDLHLGPGPDHRGTAAALVEFLAVIGDTRPEADRSIVLLGDSFNLPADDPAAACLERHRAPAPDVFAALGRARSAGVDLEVVCGNHDTALARPVVRKALEQLLLRRRGGLACAGARCGEGASVVAAPAARVPRRARAPAPRRAPDADAAGADRVVAARGLAPEGLVRHGRRRTGPPAASRDAGGRDDPRRGAEGGRGAIPGTGRRGGVARRAPRARGPHAGAHLALSHRARCGGRESPSPLAPPAQPTSRGSTLAQAAARVHSALDLHGAAVPFVVFGHTHRAQKHVIAGTSACYLNTGTWSDDVRGGGPDRADDRLFPYVRVDALDAGGVVTAQASLRYWGVSGRPGTPTGDPSAREPVLPG